MSANNSDVPFNENNKEILRNAMQPVITNNPPKNTRLSMTSRGVQDTLTSDIYNKSLEQENEKEKTVLSEEDEQPEDTSADMKNTKKQKGENKRQEKQEQKKKPRSKTSINKQQKKDNPTPETPSPETPPNNQTQPDNATTQRSPPETPTNNQTQQDNATTETPPPKTPTNNQTQPDNASPRRPLPEPPTNNQLKPVNQSHLPKGTESKGRISLSRNPLPGISSNNQKKNIDTEPKGICPKKWKLKSTQTHTLDKKIMVERRVSCSILGLKGIIMVAAIFLISSSEEISKAKPCDVEKALKSISLNYTVACSYDDIKEVSKTLRNLGISLLTVNLLFFPLTLFFWLLPRICKLVVCIIFPLVALFSVFMIMEYNDILDSKTAKNDMNYVQLQSTMTTWLEAHYTSDNISSSDVISNSWNKFFIDYECCAIHQVQGTTNDFDSTPWCTTAGTCQSTASQIPRTCCNGVSEDDYGSAPPTCHSSVNPGTFRSNCMNVIKQLSAENVKECQLSQLQMSLIIIAILELVATALEIMAVIVWIVLWALNEQKTGKEEEKIIWAFKKQQSSKEDN